MQRKRSATVRPYVPPSQEPPVIEYRRTPASPSEWPWIIVFTTAAICSFLALWRLESWPAFWAMTAALVIMGLLIMLRVAAQVVVEQDAVGRAVEFGKAYLLYKLEAKRIEAKHGTPAPSLPSRTVVIEERGEARQIGMADELDRKIAAWLRADVYDDGGLLDGDYVQLTGQQHAIGKFRRSYPFVKADGNKGTHEQRQMAARLESAGLIRWSPGVRSYIYDIAAYPTLHDAQQQLARKM